MVQFCVIEKYKKEFAVDTMAPRENSNNTDNIDKKAGLTKSMKTSNGKKVTKTAIMEKMVADALTKLKSSKGVSLRAINNHIATTFGVDMEKNNLTIHDGEKNHWKKFPRRTIQNDWQRFRKNRL